MQTYTTGSNGPASAGSGSTTDQVKDKAQQAAGQAKDQAQQAAGQAKGVVRSQVDQRSTDAGEKVGGLASDVRTIGDQLREQGKEKPAKLAEQAAARADKIGDYLKNSDGERILNDVEDLARRQPWAVIGGGALLGLLASRFLKASSSTRYEQRSSGQGYGGTYGGGYGGELPARTSDLSPGTSGLQSGSVTTGPAVPVTSPVDTTLTGGTTGATASDPTRTGGTSGFEGSR